MDLKNDISSRLAEKIMTDDETAKHAIAFYTALAIRGNQDALDILLDLKNDDDGRYDAWI